MLTGKHDGMVNPEQLRQGRSEYWRGRRHGWWRLQSQRLYAKMIYRDGPATASSAEVITPQKVMISVMRFACACDRMRGVKTFCTRTAGQLQ